MPQHPGRPGGRVREQNAASDVADVIAFDQQSPASQREGVEPYLAEKDGLGTVRTWE
jgi:hypothetical protein